MCGRMHQMVQPDALGGLGAFYVQNAPNLPPLASIPHRARHLLASCTWAKHLSDSRANCNIVCVSFATSTVS